MVYKLETGIKKAKRKISAIALGVAALSFPAVIAISGGAANAAVSNNYTLFGDASLVQPGESSSNAVEATSTGSDAFGGVQLNDPTGLTVSDLQTLSTDYKLVAGDCGAGSPRFSVSVTDGVTTGHIFFYLGPAPNYTTCPPNVWTPSGNLANSANLVDATQIGGGFYEPYSQVQADYGSFTITGISLVVDGSGQTVDFDNAQVNDTTYDFEPAQTVTVTINKYVDGTQANTTSANNSSFPMESSWTADNLGSGTGTYNLGPTGFNSPNAYEAITDEMTAGASYSTQEVTGGTVVATACTPGGAPYALAGYSTGATLAEAQSAGPSATVPAFTDLTSDMFVIVWNTKCPTTPVFAHPTSKDQCKVDGWKTMFDDNNRAFKNQGDCVSYVATHGKNKANG